MTSGLPDVREMFPGILVSLPLFSFKHLTIIKTDIFGHVCICCRRVLVAVRMSVKQTRQILGLVWVRNKFCVTPKSSRILPDAPTTELLVWGFCFALPFLFSSQLSQPLAAQSPCYLQPSGWCLFQVPVSPGFCKQCQGTGSEHDNSTIMLILFCQIRVYASLCGVSVIMVGSVMFHFQSVPSKCQTAPGWAVQYSFSTFLCSLASSLSRPAWRSHSSKLSLSKDLQELVSCEGLALIPPNLFKKLPVCRFKLVPN